MVSGLLLFLAGFVVGAFAFYVYVIVFGKDEDE